MEMLEKILDHTVLIVIIGVGAFVFGIMAGDAINTGSLNNNCKNYGYHVTDTYKLKCEVKK